MDVDGDLVIDREAEALKSHVIDHLDQVAKFCGVDVFLLGPKFTSMVDGLNGNGDAGRDERWRVAIYGDMESAEHAKTRILIFIDRLVSTKNLGGVQIGANIVLAWPCRGGNDARTFNAHSHLWSIPKEH